MPRVQGIEIAVVGEKAVRRALLLEPDRARERLLRGAVNDAAKVGERIARAGAPRRRGKLKRSIGRRIERRNTDRHRVTYVVGPGVEGNWSRRPGFYGAFLDRGTRQRYRKIRAQRKGRTRIVGRGGSTGKIRANKWLRKSFKRSIAPMVRIMHTQSVKWAKRIRADGRFVFE